MSTVHRVTAVPTRGFACIMDGLSGAASIIAVIDVSAKIISLCSKYLIAVRNSRKDIDRFQKKVTKIRDVFAQVKQLLNGHNKMLLLTTHNLSDSLKECLRDLGELETQLKPSKTHKTMSQFELRALKWPFTSK